MDKNQTLRQRIQAASGAKKAELVLKHASIVNVFTCELETADIAIEKGCIVGLGQYDGEREVDLKGKTVCPGFIDGHIHLESSMVSPADFQQAVMPHGTTAVITDPHEIANVAGTAGIEYMMKKCWIWMFILCCRPVSRQLVWMNLEQCWRLGSFGLFMRGRRFSVWQS